MCPDKATTKSRLSNPQHHHPNVLIDLGMKLISKPPVGERKEASTLAKAINHPLAGGNGRIDQECEIT